MRQACYKRRLKARASVQPPFAEAYLFYAVSGTHSFKKEIKTEYYGLIYVQVIDIWPLETRRLPVGRTKTNRVNGAYRIVVIPDGA